MNNIDRFKKRKQILKNISTKDELSIVDNKLVKMHEESEIDSTATEHNFAILDAKYNFEFNSQVSEEEVTNLFKEVKNNYDSQRLDDLIKECKSTIISSIIGPFGIAKFISKHYDKVGGNVTTLTNFKKGIVATEQDDLKYQEWKASTKEFDRSPYDYDIKLNKYGDPVVNKDGKFVLTGFNRTKNKEYYKNLKEGDSIKSGYTNKTIGTKHNNQIIKNTSIDLEHITSTKEIELDPKNHLYSKGTSKAERQKDRVDTARNDSNLTRVEGSINSSKQDKDLLEWANSKNRNDSTKTNAEYYNCDDEALSLEYKKSKDFIKNKQNMQQFQKQSKELISTSTKEAARMGFQQALGIVVHEFFDAVFDEAVDIFKNGIYADNNNQDLFTELKRRLNVIKDRIMTKKDEVTSAFKEGFLSGFLSNLITFIINTFVTTGKRLVRIIREGFFSLMQAFKLLFFTPDKLTSSQAAHEASKLIASGVVIVAGVGLEEGIEKLLVTIPALVPVKDIISTVLIGGITGLLSTFIVYGIDKLDFFKVNEMERNQFIIDQMSQELDQLFEEADNIIEEFQFIA